MYRLKLDRRGGRRKFKATWPVILGLGLIAALCVTSWVGRMVYYDMMVSAADDKLTVMRAATFPVYERNQVIEEQQGQIEAMEHRFQELMRNPITFKQTYFLETEILPRTRKHGIPDALAASQWALESNRQVHRPGHNYWGIMQWDAQGKRSLRTFATLDDAITMYANTIKNILKRKGFTYDPKEDPHSILKKLQYGNYRYEGDNDDPMIYVNHISSLKEFQYYLRKNI